MRQRKLKMLILLLNLFTLVVFSLHFRIFDPKLWFICGENCNKKFIYRQAEIYAGVMKYKAV